MSDDTVTLITTYAIRVVAVVAVFYVAYRLSGWAGRRVTALLNTRKFDKALTGFIGNLVKWGLIIMATLACLGAFGIETASFAALIAGAGLAIGLAFQGSLSNFAAGIMLLAFRPFTIGDLIQVAGVTGKVKQIGIFTTDLDTVDNRRIIVPNGQIFGSTIENVTYNETRRVDVSVGVAYDTPIDRAREVILGAVEDVEGLLEDPAPAAFLVSLGGSSIDWQLRVWCSTDDYWGIHEAATRAVKRALDKAEIGIPYPTMDINMIKAA